LILAVDTDVLVNWVMSGAPSHRAVRELLEDEVRGRGQRLGVTLQVLLEFLHITTDPRRFETPLSMEQALEWSQSIWDGKEVARLLPGPLVLTRTLELMRSYRLGRKRILDTALAATLEVAGVKKLATMNGKDFGLFPFLELVPVGARGDEAQNP
jgi:predicted nucleic acid-binding protein